MSTGVITYLVAFFGLFLGFQQAPATMPPTAAMPPAAIPAPVTVDTPVVPTPPVVSTEPAATIVPASIQSPAPTAELAACLSDKGAKLYGAYWCSHCNSQKAMFGDGLVNLNYVECDAGGSNGNPDACIAAGIEAYPTWQKPGSTPLVGVQRLESLAVWSGCPYTP